MKIIQLVSNLNYGDAIGNDIRAIHETLLRAGYASEIMAVTIHERMREYGKPVDLSSVKEEDVVLFHKASGDPFTGELRRLPCYKILIYHNITPASWFLPYDAVMSLNQFLGRRQLKRELKDMDEAWGDSDYNRQELIRYGFPAEKTEVLPILLDLDTPGVPPPRERKKEGPASILFLGRIVPNKKQDDIIRVFSCYLEYDPEARLILIGSWDGWQKYYAKLRGLMADLGLREDQVLFSGHVTDEEKEAYLSGADLFLCMSEHEGFCIPVLEAMSHDIPVIARRTSALPETIGENGLLFDHKDYEGIAREIARLRSDDAFRASVLARQRENLKRFSRERTEKKLLDLIEKAIRNKGKKG